MQEWQKLTGPAFQLSIALLVLAVGLRASWYDVTYLFRQPALLARSVLARNVIVPGMTMLLIQIMSLEPPVNAALLALSVAAVPPILPQSLMKAGGREPYAFGLLTSQTMLAIALVPLSLTVFNALLGLHARFAPRQVAPIMLMLTLLPLAIGVVCHKVVPWWSHRAAKVAHGAGAAMLAIALLGVFAVAWRPWLALVGNGTLIAMVLLTLVGLGAGHLFGGPRGDDRTSLSLACASSHPGLAIAIIAANTTQANAASARLASAAVLLGFLVQGVVRFVFKRARRPIVTGALSRRGLDRRGRKRPGRDRRGATA
jgi:BASS family bile acid:Na+ symporter